ncbi:MAG: 1-acyl-sn-glycerol-3-phosphate acyltransferase, partial [Myxococcota bacterium]
SSQEEELSASERLRRIREAWTGMQERLNFPWQWLARRYTKELTFPQERHEELLEAANQGTLVYILRSQSYVSYFLYNALFLRERLPRSRFAQGLFWVPWAPFWRNVWVFFTGWLGRILGSGGKSEKQVFQNLVEIQEATTLFLDRPKTWLTHLRGGVYQLRNLFRRFFGLSPAPGGHDNDLFHNLVELQKQQSTPIFLCPQILILTRAPTHAARSWGDVFFGEKEYPGTLREILLFLRDYRASQVRGGPPINLQALMEDHPQWDTSQLVGYLRDRINQRFEREYRIVTGPRQRSAEEIKSSVLQSQSLKDQIKDIAKHTGEPIEAITRKAQKHLDRMAANLKMSVARFFDVVLNTLWRHMYSGIAIDRTGIEQLREAALKAPIVLLPSHKSYVDFLIMSQVFYRYNLKIPNIAAGDNLLLPIIGWIFRSSGAFFIRRSFGNDRLYRTVFREYIALLLRERHNIEFFIEGGRSRTGKL